MINTASNSKCWFVLCLVLLHVILLSIPTMLGVYAMTSYFEMSHSIALSITITVICTVTQMSLINVNKFVMLYDNITQQVHIVQ